MKKSPLESSIADACETLSVSYETYSKQYEDQIRRSPLSSVLCAAAIGYMLQFLPLGRIALGLSRILVNLIQPAVLVFGLVKLISSVSQDSEKAPEMGKKPKK